MEECIRTCESHLQLARPSGTQHNLVAQPEDVPNIIEVQIRASGMLGNHAVILLQQPSLDSVKYLLPVHQGVIKLVDEVIPADILLHIHKEPFSGCQLWELFVL